jgi:hypothetical protein
VAEDVLEHLVVAAEAAAFEACLRPRAVELRCLQEGRIFGGSQQRVRVELASQRRPRAHFDDTSVERGAIEAPRDRDAMVAVDHVVVIAHLVDVDWRQLVALDHLAVDAQPALARPAVDRHEGGIEVAGLRRGRRRTDDAIQRNLAYASKSSAFKARGLEHRFDGLKPASAPGQDRTDGACEGAEAGSVEVLECPDPLHQPLTLALSPSGERGICCYRRACSLSASKK